MKLMAVNEVIDNLNDVAGEYLYIEGILTFQFECICVNHWPKSERRSGWLVLEGGGLSYDSSLWIDVGYGAFSFNRDVLSRWNGKRVVVGGELLKPDPDFEGVGHMSLWPASVLATQIELLKEWQKNV